MFRICVATGSRAEYGLLVELMRELHDDAEVQLQILATGAHLVAEQGFTYQQIENDGFTIDAKVDMLMASDSAVGIAKSMGIAIIGVADALDRLRPDIIVVLGDRYEMLAVVQTALVFDIPAAHIHGGELTEGAIDDCVRHAITKMSKLHFTAAEEYRQRVIQLGEQPGYVYNVGPMALDAIRKTKLLSKEELEASLSFPLKKYNFLITYHSETLLTDKENMRVLDEMLDALAFFPEAGLLFTGANADVCGKKINERIMRYVAKEPQRAAFFRSLGRQRYFSALQYVDLVLGNSSSGVIEAPFFGKPTVNIGDRQKGRIQSNSVLTCTGKSREIKETISEALMGAFQKQCWEERGSLCEGQTCAERIVGIIKWFLNEGTVRKTFYDLYNVGMKGGRS